MKDPLGKAISTYIAHPSEELEILVHSKICDDDVIPVHYLFRTFNDFPELEKIAVSVCKGKTLDVGAGAGAHSIYLHESGIDVLAMDISPTAVEYIQSKGVRAIQANFFEYQEETFDTILMLMNGIGIAGTLSNLENTLKHAYQLLNKDGQLVIDTSDIYYIYQEEDGSVWMDLNTEYYGDFNYQMEFQEVKGEWFKWLFVDLRNLTQSAENIGFEVELLYEYDDQYLVRLKK